jgi:uncharacterized protein (DUF362 family)
MTTSGNEKEYCVRAVHCDYRSSDEEVYQALRRATAPFESMWQRLRKARRIGIKFNQDGVPNLVKYYEGHRMQLVSDPVTRATLRLLREETTAEIFALDVGVEGPLTHGQTRQDATTILPILREMGIPFVHGPDEPVAWVNVPGGGQMFERYPIPRSCAEADEMVSVQKLKNHVFMGVTLTLKNLFGLAPILPDGRPRVYYHHLVRMPYMLADYGRIFHPALNIVDGLVCQAGEEWGPGNNPRICNTLVAGDHTIATDACATWLMGHDPQADWRTPPFLRDRNALRVAAEGGFGTVNLEEIDFQSEVQAPLGEFFAKSLDSHEMIHSWRRTTAEQGLYYRDHRKEIAGKYAGKYILLQMNEVRWADESGTFQGSRRNLSGLHPEQGMWMKYVDPDEAEGEHYEVYEQTLKETA